MSFWALIVLRLLDLVSLGAVLAVPGGMVHFNEEKLKNCVLSPYLLF